MEQDEFARKYEEAQQHYRAKAFRDCLALLSELNVARPDSVAVLQSEALCLAAMGRAREARVVLKQLKDRTEAGVFTDLSTRVEKLLAKSETAAREPILPPPDSDLDESSPWPFYLGLLALALVLAGCGAFWFFMVR